MLANKAFRAASNGLAGYLLALFLAGTGYVVPAYLVLTLYSVPRLPGYKWGPVKAWLVAEAVVFGVMPHVIVSLYATPFMGLTLASYAAAFLTAFIEEAFFRHTLRELGEPLSALLYALYHLSFRSPVYLFLSALLLPLFFLLGCLFYEVYVRRGLLYAFAAHAAFNAAAISYLVDAQPIYALVYALSAGAVYVAFRVYMWWLARS